MDVRKTILPIYQDLCKPEMLAKCMHGKTQNANESFNGMIWNRVPKANHVGLKRLSLAVYDAISHFNIGAQAALEVMKLVNICPGFYMLHYCNKTNVVRKRHSNYRMSAIVKKRRTILRNREKKRQDKCIENEGGASYEAGAF